MVFISFCLNAPISKRETEAQSRVTGKWVWGYGLCGSEAQRQSSGANCRGPGSSPDKSQMGTWGGGAVDMGGTLLKGPTRWSLGPWSSVLVSCAAPSLCPKAHITDTFSGHQASPQIAGFLLWGWGGEVPKPRGWVRGSYPHPRAGVLPASPRASSSLTVAGGRGLHL